jgi:hypothetical protein
MVNLTCGPESAVYKHGQSYIGDWRQPKRTPLYRLWVNMRNRCRNPRNPNYPYYGGRGIKITPAWEEFAAFSAAIEAAIGPHPGAGWTLDRIDNNGHYESGNVRWATRLQQVRNRNCSVLNEAAAKNIRAARASGELIKSIAQRFSTSEMVIAHVIHGRCWRDV